MAARLYGDAGGSVAAAGGRLLLFGLAYLDCLLCRSRPLAFTGSVRNLLAYWDRPWFWRVARRLVNDLARPAERCTASAMQVAVPRALVSPG